MRWRKRGLIYAPDGTRSWARHTALQPTPYLLSPTTVRVFVGLRDAEGVGRVGFVDVAADDPSRVLRVSDRPALDVGRPGTFDENGVVPCAVVPRGRDLFLYYAGYQLGRKVRFCVFGGLAVSRDGGESFQRHREVPVLDRTPDELFFRVAHSVLPSEGGWRVWYGGGSEWVPGPDRPLPVYDIRYLESRDGVEMPRAGVPVVRNAAGEYRVGRPYVIRHGTGYRMFYCAATVERGYRLGYADSADGLNWERKDDHIGIDLSPAGWDSEMIGYPAVLSHRNRTFLFYNGNNLGATGFGYAELEEW
jgi:hypothetical protein